MRRVMLGALAALAIVSPAAGQSEFPTAAIGVKAGGVVHLVCDANGRNCAPESAANPGFTVARGGTGLATAQVSVGTAATLIASARLGRQRISLTIGAATSCAFGPAGVTLATGFPLQPVAGAVLTLDTAAAVYAVCSATTTVSDVETY